MIRADCVRREYRSQHLNSSFRRLARSVLSLSARGILSRLRARVAALTVLFLAVAVPASAQMQLIGNTALPSPNPLTISSSFTQAQAFTTGTNTEGYTITSVGLLLTRAPTGGTLNVQIWSTGGGQAPNAVLHTLTNPATYTANAVNTFTATGVTLAANTTYSIVASHTGSGNGEGGATSSDLLDGTTAPGWSMNTGRHFRGTGGTWSTNSSRMMIAINGSQVIGNRAPTVRNEIPDQMTTTGASFSYTIPADTFSDPDGDDITYSITTVPSWLTFDSDTQTLTGTAPSTTGTHVISVIASDGSLTTSDSFNITVTQANRAPTLANALVDQTATVGTAFSYQFAANTFNDADGDTLTYTTSTLPTGLSFDAGTRTFSGTPTAAGTPTITVTATDPDGETVSGMFTITVAAAPGVTVSPGTVAVAEGGTATYTVVLDTQPTGDVMVTPSSDVTANVTVSGTLTFTTSNWNTAQTVTVTGVEDSVVNDPARTATISHMIAGGGYGSVTVSDVTVTVTDNDAAPQTNRAPTVANALVDQTATTGVAFSYQFAANTFSDPDGDTLTYTASTLPTGLSFDAGTRTFSGTPTAAGTHTIMVTATDPDGEAVSGSFTITVAAASGVTVDPGTVTVVEGGTATYTVVLNTLPTGDVTVTPSSDAMGNATVSSALTFTTSNWNTAQTVTVTGVEDSVVNDPARTATISHAVSGGGYDSATVSDVTVTVVDNDAAPGVTVDPGTVTVTEDGTATYTVVLASPPTGDVTVTPSSSATDSATVMPETLTFTTGNWYMAQTVTVTGVDDDIDNPSDRVATITHAVSGYGSVTAADSVTVTVRDDDNAITPMVREQTVSITLAAVATRAVSAATESIGPRFDALPPPGLTVAGQPVTFSPTGLTAAACSGTDGLLGRHRAGSLGSGGGCAVAYDSRDVTPGELLGSSAFSVTLGATHGTSPQTVQWSLWGRGDAGSFEGQPEGLSYDGRTRNAWLGADARTGHWVAGLAASASTGETDYSITNGAEGQLETEITALWPYAGWTADSGLSLQGMLGIGEGELRQIDEEISRQKLSLKAGVLGLSWRTARLNGPALAMRVDASLAELSVTGNEEQGTDDLSVGSWRLRSGVEASWRHLLSGGGMIEPFLEAVARRDGGDGLVGVGFEMAGGLRYVSSRVQAEARGRWLASHAEADVKESGASATLRVKPLPGGHGLSLSLGPRWGADTGGADALWQEGLPGLSGAERVTLDARMGYGFGLGRRGLMTPFAETSGNDSRLGVRLRAGIVPVDAELASEANGYSARIGMRLRF